jgi:hypothetical protein
MTVISNKSRSAGHLPVVFVGEHLGAQHFTVGECDILQSSKLHFSISHQKRDPTWEEIASARYALLPKLRDCVMVLPPDDEYANAHEHCFHVHVLRSLAPGGSMHNPDSW